MKKIIFCTLISLVMISCQDEYYTEGYVKTHSVTDITNSSVTLNGSVTISSTHNSVVRRGFVYGSAINLSINNNGGKTYDGGSSQGEFSANINGLLPLAHYYAKSFVAIARKNDKNVYSDSDYHYFYGNTIEFTTADGVILPSITTLAATDITATSAALRGTISSAGHPVYTKRGFVYSTNQNPKLGSTGLPGSNVAMIEVQGTGTGDFSAVATGLTANSTYYVRAYAAIDNENIAYGEQASFVAQTTLPYVELTTAGIAVQKTDITPSNTNWTSAESLCNNSIIGGYTDWRIPTVNELATLFSNRIVIGGFQGVQGGISPAYWSSTPSSANSYYVINFTSGNQATENRSYSFSGSLFYYCRCVRTLTE